MRRLRVEGVDVAVGEHGGHDEVLEALHAPLHARLVVVLEGLEEVVARALPLALAHVHLAWAGGTARVRVGVRFRVGVRVRVRVRPMCILPPHSRMTPMIFGCGIALLIANALL